MGNKVAAVTGAVVRNIHNDRSEKSRRPPRRPPATQASRKLAYFLSMPRIPMPNSGMGSAFCTATGSTGRASSPSSENQPRTSL